MAIIRWEPFSMLRGLNNPLEDFDMVPRINSGDFSMDVRETEEEVTVEVSAPGFSEELFNLFVKNGVLTVNGRREEIIEESNNGRTMREIRRGNFTRSVYVGEVKETEATAKYNNGILTITLPKEEKPEAINIPIIPAEQKEPKLIETNKTEQ